MKTLLVLGEPPYPPRQNGYRLRYYSLLTRLSKSIDIDLVVLHRHNEPDNGWQEAIRPYVKTIHLIEQGSARASLWRRAKGYAAKALPFGAPYACVQHDANELTAALHALARDSYDVIAWGAPVCSQAMLGFLEKADRPPVLFDVMDSMHLYAHRELASRNPVNRLILRKLRNWEASLVRGVDLAMYISPIDLQWVKPWTDMPLLLSPNGVTIDDYRPDRITIDGRSLGYLGNMSYEPNVAAAHSLYDIYRSIKASMPDLQLWFIGRDPAANLVQRMKQDADVHFTGTVENIWPYVNAIDVFVLPMTRGAGQQNKVLEIMYAGRPAICTAVANGGVSATHGKEALIADDPAEIARLTRQLLEDRSLREEIGQRGKAYIEHTFSWNAIAEQFLKALQEVARNHRR